MKVLFICKGNWFRSQMAEAIYNKLTHTQDAISAGTHTGASDEPEGQVLSDILKNENFFEVMEKHGLNVRSNRSNRLLPQMLNDADIVISMAEEPFIPDFLKNNPKVIWWDIDNPDHISKEVAENTYTKIHRLVTSLIKNLC